jgi:hypothetical protein
MVIFPVGIEYALDVAVQRSHDANAREHRGGLPGEFLADERGSMGMGRAQQSATRNGRQSAFPTLKPNLMGSADC